jgi:tetratricopeptide (TPR) repeat protein
VSAIATLKNPVLFLILLLSFAVTKAQTAEEFYNKALAQLDEGVKVNDVLKTLDMCILADKNYEEAYYMRAFIFYKMEEFDNAIEEYNTILAISPYNEEALKFRALAKLQSYDYEGAMEDHNQRLLLRPANPVIYFDRAYCKGLLNDIPGSIDDYSQAISLNPGYREAYANRAMATLNLIAHPPASYPGKFRMADVCKDLEVARTLGDSTATRTFRQFCQ